MFDDLCIKTQGLSKVYTGTEVGTVEALQPIDLEIKKGESVGIVGHNGAGKSTLLKLLSRITPPSSGEAFINGKLTSLLEVGTGLHPELSGEDNILLYGSILGLSFNEIRKLQPQIVAFSGLEDSLSLPIKKYSSGMKLRLAFSVMAHLPVDILALDEVLAVGDSMFQQQCMQRMMNIKNQGHTLLFVSHDLSAVSSLCERTIVIEKGKKVFDGPTNEAISFYRSNSDDASNQKELASFRQGNESAWFNSIHMLPTNFEKSAIIEGVIKIDSIKSENTPFAEIGINIRSLSGADIYHLSNRFIDLSIELDESNEIRFSIEHQLKPGKYHICLYLKVNDIEQQWIENAITFEYSGTTPYSFADASQIQAELAPNFSITKM